MITINWWIFTTFVCLLQFSGRSVFGQCPCGPVVQTTTMALQAPCGCGGQVARQLLGNTATVIRNWTWTGTWSWQYNWTTAAPVIVTCDCTSGQPQAPQCNCGVRPIERQIQAIQAPAMISCGCGSVTRQVNFVAATTTTEAVTTTTTTTRMTTTWVIPCGCGTMNNAQPQLINNNNNNYNLQPSPITMPNNNANAGGCSRTQFLCGAKCIHDNRLCDPFSDCSGQNCRVQCRQDQFKCGDSAQCVSSNYRCDGNWNCINGADERGCSACKDSFLFPSFHCSNNVCISKWDTCDGNNNCGDYSDEAKCPYLG